MKNPFFNCTVISPFGERQRSKDGISQFHRGIDCECPGDNVPSGINGIVTELGEGRVEGKYVQITGRISGVIFYTRYLHLSKIVVEKDIKVQPEDIVAVIGKSGIADRVHLHLELFTYDIMSDFINKLIDEDVSHFSKGRKLYFELFALFKWCDENDVEY